MNYGYARVSTIAQNLDRQLEELLKIGIDSTNIYTDKDQEKILIELALRNYVES